MRLRIGTLAASACGEPDTCTSACGEPDISTSASAPVAAYHKALNTCLYQYFFQYTHQLLGQLPRIITLCMLASPHVRHCTIGTTNTPLMLPATTTRMHGLAAAAAALTVTLPQQQ